MSDINDRKKRPCVVPTCYGERFNLVHKFPMENDRTFQWLNALNISSLYKVPYDKLRSSYFVCSRHFRSQDYKNELSRHLNKTAIPCINIKKLNQMDQVSKHRTHPRPSHLINNTVTNNDDDDDDDNNDNGNDNETSILSSSILISKNNSEENLNNKTILKRTYSKCNEYNNEQNSDNNDNENDDDDDAEYTSMNKTKKINSNLIQLDKNHFIISCLKDNSNLSSSGFDEINNQFAIENLKNEEKEGEEYDEEERREIEIIEEEEELENDERNDNVFEDENSINCKMNDKFEVSEHILILKDDLPKKKTILQNKDSKNFVSMTSKFLKVKHSNYSETLSLDYFWLRDHCRCFTCYNYGTNQRRFNLLDIQLDIRPQSYELKDDKLFITWDDDHQSEYDVDLLYKSQFDYIKKNLPKQILWDRKKIIDEQYARVDLGKLVIDDNMIEKILKSLITYGIAFIENVPPNQDMTEMAVRRLFPIQKTFFGEMWTFNDTQNDNHFDTAYTKDYLEAHTDNTYFYDAAGLQIFHCLEHINGIGGETFLIDGYKIIQDLMNQNYDAYQKLIEYNVPAEYIENDKYHTYTAPIIRLNYETKKPEQIRFNLYDRAILNTIPQNEIHEFYEHFRYLTKLIQNKENQWKFKLKPGTILIFDNWRILHGRESYTGKRTLSGCYVSRTDFLSKARTLGLIR